MISNNTALKAIEEYGGVNLWESSQYIEAEVSAKGLAFTLKRRPFFKNAKIVMEISRPYSRLTPIGNDMNVTGVLDGNDVRLEDDKGNLIAERQNSRGYFPFGRRLFFWDDLDMAYFANYAFWNYFTLPKLLMKDDILWTEISDYVLEAKFPEYYPTHSKVQRFFFNKNSGLLEQHNYTVDIISKYANAAHIILEHNKNGNHVYPSLRLVTPQYKKGKAMKSPILIDIKVHNFKLISNKI